VSSPGRARKQFVRRGAAVLVVAAGLVAAAGVAFFPDSQPRHASSALSFRNLHEQQQFVRAELIRLEPNAVIAAATAPRFAGHGLL